MQTMQKGIFIYYTYYLAFQLTLIVHDAGSGSPVVVIYWITSDLTLGKNPSSVGSAKRYLKYSQKITVYFLTFVSRSHSA